MQTHNITAKDKGFQMEHILWALRDKSFFKRVIQVLRDRFLYDEEVWSYGFYHLDDEEVCREYLEATDPYALNNLI
jgi:hypothetical protein